ncbi:hypothetical protein ACFU8Q_19610 [Streptomyces sp. NPDC057543]|uniref:hypothetical protein n=1 Tax=Streptomyces sp. NPDC057543 TaxID=3346163 RepID=UPI0036B187FB
MPEPASGDVRTAEPHPQRVHGMRELTEIAELLASELVTNAYLYSSGRIPCGCAMPGAAG